MSAMPPAVAVLVKHPDAIAQKGPKVPQMPAAAIEIATSDRNGERVIAASVNPTAPTIAETVKCQRRSPFKSDDLPIRTIANAAPINGSADSIPIPKSLRWPSPPMI